MSENPIRSWRFTMSTATSAGEFAHMPPSTYERSCAVGLCALKYVGAAELARMTSVTSMSPSDWLISGMTLNSRGAKRSRDDAGTKTRVLASFS